jgi:CRISPR system Cascade subunit CasB
LLDKPSFYRLMAGKGTDKAWQRVAFFLPYVIKDRPGAEALGRQLARAKISEMRLFQVLRSDYPNDLIQLRRLVQQVEPSLDWQAFGETLYYWNKSNKQRILQDFFLATTPEDKTKTQGSSK